MKNFTTTLDFTFSIADLHCMEDFILEYTDASVIEQELEGIPECDIDRVYYDFIVSEFLRESVLREKERQEYTEAA